MEEKKIYLFIDRDGTLIEEPKPSLQVDSFEKLAFLDDVVTALSAISTTLPYHLVMVTNQDGLGTASFPEEDFWPVHNLMMQVFTSQGILFEEVLIDKSFEHENKPTRKPGIGMFEEYLKRKDIDWENSWVIGDRATDVVLAKNLGCKSIRIDEENDSQATATCRNWSAIKKLLLLPDRVAYVERKTKETDIKISLNLDGQGKADIHTGLGFFDHMLEQIAKHGQMDLEIKTVGDLHIDEHHTIEDTGLALGSAFLKALGNKKGILRYAFLLPMDEARAEVSIDFSGRSWLVWEAEFKREKVGDVPTELFNHFFKSFSDEAKCTLHIRSWGENEHHKIESIFKAFAKVLMTAVKRDETRLSVLPSTKGVL